MPLCGLASYQVVERRHQGGALCGLTGNVVAYGHQLPGQHVKHLAALPLREGLADAGNDSQVLQTQSCLVPKSCATHSAQQQCSVKLGRVSKVCWGIQADDSQISHGQRRLGPQCQTGGVQHCSEVSGPPDVRSATGTAEHAGRPGRKGASLSFADVNDGTGGRRHHKAPE